MYVSKAMPIGGLFPNIFTATLKISVSPKKKKSFSLLTKEKKTVYICFIDSKKKILKIFVVISIILSDLHKFLPFLTEIAFVKNLVETIIFGVIFG